MANLTYNGVPIEYLSTRKYAAETVYTDDRADWEKTRHEVYVEGLVYASAAHPFAADYFTQLRHMLEQPRRDLLYTVNGKTILQSGPALDVENGPHPEVVAIDRVMGSEALRVSFRVTTATQPCPPASGGKGLPAWLSNRWEEYQTIGPDHLSTLVRVGKITTTTSVTGIVDTDALRGVVTPPIRPFFNRVKAEYKVLSSGLGVQYTFADQEVEDNPPAPAVKIDEASYTEISPDGAIRYGEARVGLTGRPRGNRKALLATAILIGVRRLQEAGAMGGGRKDTPTVMSLHEELVKNKVTVSFRCLLPGTNAGDTARGLGASIGKWLGRAGGATAGFFLSGGNPWAVGAGWIAGGAAGEELGGAAGGGLAPPVPRLPADLAGWGLNVTNLTGAISGAPDPTLRGALPGLTLLAQALNDPCLGIFNLVPGGGPFGGGTDPRALAGGRPGVVGSTDLARPVPPAAAPVPPAAVVSVVSSLDADLPLVEASLAPPGVYTDYKINCRWEDHPMVAHLAATAEDGTSAFVPWASPAKQLVIDWHGSRAGGPVAVPPSDLGGNYVLLNRQSDNPELGVAADGVTVTQTRGGRMIFGVVDPSKVVEGSAVPPWVIDQLTALRQQQGSEAAAGIAGIMAVAALASAEQPGMLPWLDAQPPSQGGQGGQGGGQLG